SLDRNGRGGMVAPLKLPDGNANLPSWCFSSETTLGAYRPTAGVIAFTKDGTELFRVTAGSPASVTFPATTEVNGGSATFTDDVSVGGVFEAGSVTSDGPVSGTSGNFAGVVTANTLIANGGAGCLRALPGLLDHTYLGFYPRTASPATMGGYVGFGGGGT